MAPRSLKIQSLEDKMCKLNETSNETKNSTRKQKSTKFRIFIVSRSLIVLKAWAFMNEIEFEWI